MIHYLVIGHACDEEQGWQFTDSDKELTSIVTIEFAYNNRVAESKEEYIELLKEQYRDDYNIELSNSEITNI